MSIKRTVEIFTNLLYSLIEKGADFNEALEITEAVSQTCLLRKWKENLVSILCHDVLDTYKQLHDNFPNYAHRIRILKASLEAHYDPDNLFY